MSFGILSVIVMMLVSGCEKTSVEQTKLSIQRTQWSEMGSAELAPIVSTPLTQGDVLYDDDFAKIKIKSVDENRIVLTVKGCMVEPKDNGAIDMRAKPKKKIELECGQSIELVSQSMDFGVNLLISYEQNQP